MRKALKRNLIEALKTLYEAHDVLEEFIDKKEYDNVQSLLNDCQDMAVQLGTIIEESEGDGFISVSFLEKYCEVVYQIAIDVKALTGAKVRKLLNKNLRAAENSVKNDIKVKLEVVFMPYKSSMWDSLESVWKAADEDSDCDAYVVPIPYYDRRGDFSFGEFHYEGANYPDYVPVVHYATYNLEKRQPDIIYIHSPYDGYNYVTSIDPRFYSSELKKYTQCLAYIPYCVYDEPKNPDDLNTIEASLRYATPVMLTADKIILQSDNFCRLMVNVLLKQCGKSKEFWEKKIVGLGSPKYDKVLGVKPSDLQIPDNWRKQLEKSNGKSKKVILYNTSLNPLLANDKKMILKIRSVLKFFYEKREECTLIWRPHPLMEATVKSLRPVLWEEYSKIVDEYIEGGWGIYDDSRDFNLAFALSDAYYGDSSSLVPLYQATGKPLLIQNVDIVDYGKRLVTDNMYYDGQYIWSTAVEFNGLFRIEPDTCEVEYMGQFPDEDMEGYELFYGITECNNKLYFCPYNAKSIAVYDKTKLKFDRILLKEDIRRIDRKFNGILVYGKYICLKGSSIFTLIRINTETDEVVYFEDWGQEIEKRKNYAECYIASGCIFQDRLHYYCPSVHSLLVFDLTNFSYGYIPLHGKVQDRTLVLNNNDLFWLLQKPNGLISYSDFETGIITELAQLKGASCFCSLGEYVYYFSLTELFFCRVHSGTKEITNFPIDKGICFAYAVENRIFMISWLTGELFVFDTITLTVTKTELLLDKVRLPDLNLLKLTEKEKKYNGYARETGFLNLGNLFVLDAISTSLEIVEQQSNCGIKIHEHVKGEIL